MDEHEEQERDLEIGQWLDLDFVSEDLGIPLRGDFATWFLEQHEEFSRFLQHEYQRDNTHPPQASATQPFPAIAESLSSHSLQSTAQITTTTPQILPAGNSINTGDSAANSLKVATDPSEETLVDSAPEPLAPMISGKYSKPVYGARTTDKLGNGKTAQYRQLIDFPLADTPLPPGTSCVNIVERFPNHLCGSNLNAFLQYFWSAEKIVKNASPEVKAVWIEQGIHGKYSNPANFIRNRLDTYAEKVLGEAGLRKLISEPKERPSGLSADKEYGKSNPLGLNLNHRSATSARTGPRKSRIFKSKDA